MKKFSKLNIGLALICVSLTGLCAPAQGNPSQPQPHQQPQSQSQLQLQPVSPPPPPPLQMMGPPPCKSTDYQAYAFDPQRVTDINYYINQYNTVCQAAKANTGLDKHCTFGQPVKNLVVQRAPVFSKSLSSDNAYTQNQSPLTGTTQAQLQQAATQIKSLSAALSALVQTINAQKGSTCQLTSLLYNPNVDPVGW